MCILQGAALEQSSGEEGEEGETHEEVDALKFFFAFVMLMINNRVCRLPCILRNMVFSLSRKPKSY